MVRILIVDDHEIARSGLRLLLAGLPGVEVVEAGSAREAREVLLRGGVDLLLLDLSLPDRDGLEFLADLRASGRRPRTLVVSAFSEAEFALAASSSARRATSPRRAARPRSWRPSAR